MDAFQTIRRILPYTSIALVIALSYAGWTIWSRQRENRNIEQESKAAEANRDAEVIRRYGGNDLKILMFTANPPIIKRGETALLCYGVNNAAKVQINPSAGEIAPSISRCVDVRPTANTQYILTASDAHGKQASQTVSLTVTH